MLRLLLRIEHFLQSQHLVHKEAVGLGNFGKQFLELLHLLLGSRELFSHDANVMTRCEIFRSLRSPGRWCFSANVVKIILASDPEVGMLEFESLHRKVSIRPPC